jgi:conjugal transfer pilin signal peptidase TrbI
MHGKVNIFVIILGTVLIGFCGYFIDTRLVFSESDSVRYRLFLKVSTPPAPGDYVLVSKDALREEDIELIKKHGINNIPSIVKKIGCSEGEILTVNTNLEYYCGSEYLGQAKTKTRKGFPLKPFIWNGPVPEGKVFIIGDNPYSYDSRYIGFVDRSHIITTLSPVF